MICTKTHPNPSQPPTPTHSHLLSTRSKRTLMCETPTRGHRDNLKEYEFHRSDKRCTVGSESATAADTSKTEASVLVIRTINRSLCLMKLANLSHKTQQHQTIGKKKKGLLAFT